MFKTEFEFTLPKGYIDNNQELHRKGIMRLATARDEISAMNDARVRNNSNYASVLVLSKVIVKLGSLDGISAEMMENLYTSDLQYLQKLYETINEGEDVMIQVTCPHCGKTFDDTLNFMKQE